MEAGRKAVCVARMYLSMQAGDRPLDGVLAQVPAALAAGRPAVEVCLG